MPVYKIIHHNPKTQILIWKITESLEQLNQEVQLNEKNQLRFASMKSEMHQRAFLSVRKLLSLAGYTDFDLYYDLSGKPHLNPNNQHTAPVKISITHSHHFSALIISNEAVGIDIEMQRDTILKVAAKFVNEGQLERLLKTNPNEHIKKLTVKWGAKEAIFKIKNKKGISFKNHIQVAPFELNDKRTTAILDFEPTQQVFELFFEEIDGYILVYAFEQI